MSRERRLTTAAWAFAALLGGERPPEARIRRRRRRPRCSRAWWRRHSRETPTSWPPRKAWPRHENVLPKRNALPDPMLSVGYTNDGWSPSLGTQPMTTLAVMASQDLPYSRQARAQGRYRLRETGQVEQQVARVRLRIAADVKRAYYGLLLARQLLAITREQRDLWREIEGVRARALRRRTGGPAGRPPDPGGDHPRGAECGGADGGGRGPPGRAQSTSRPSAGCTLDTAASLTVQPLASH